MAAGEQVEQLLRDFLAAAALLLTDAEVGEIKAFIDVGEYGLALETAVDIFVEERKVAPPDLIRRIEQAARAMDLEPVFFLKRLRK